MSTWETGRTERERQLHWAVLGASGFVGKGIVEALRDIESANVHTLKAPRIVCPTNSEATSVMAALHVEQQVSEAVDKLAIAFDGIDIVVNAAGLAAPDSTDSDVLYGANSLLPVVIAEAAKRAEVHKFVHISSAAVQGNKEILDESPSVDAFSAYSRSKALGEQAIALWNQRETQRHMKQLQVVIIRATSVQGPGRPTTTTLKQVARSRLASVAKPGDQPSVVSSLAGLSKFVVSVGSCMELSPQILIQPWEGASVRDVMQLAGEGRSPMMIPGSLARTGVNLLKVCGFLHPRFRGLARRLEVMWFGQNQIAGWAIENGLATASQNGPADTLREVLARNTTLNR